MISLTLGLVRRSALNVFGTNGQVAEVADLVGHHDWIATGNGSFQDKITGQTASLPASAARGLMVAGVVASIILILDEATSALDYESERIIQDNMKKIVQGRTVIVIAHRLAAVRPCDRIIAVKRGQIVEEGSHLDLLARKDGVYAHLWSLQTDQARA